MTAFPVDDFTLDRVEEALNTSLGDRDPVTGRHERVGGEFTLSQLLDFYSGYDPTKIKQLSEPGDEPEVVEYVGGSVYHPHDVIRALIAEVRRLRAGQP